MRIASIIGLACLLGTVDAAAQDAPDLDRIAVGAAFSKAVERRMSSIDAQEQRREKEFRKDRNYGNSFREAGVFRFAESQTEGTRWAGETLLPEIEDFTVANLVRALTVDNLARAVPDFRGTISYDIRRLKVANHPVAILQGISSYASGRIVVTAADGTLIADEKVTANLVVDPTVDRSYQGPKYAFRETEENLRVGPTLAYFVEKALERVWPEQADAIHGPVIIRISGPNEFVNSGG